MDQTITGIDTITLRIPLDIWAPAPMSQGVPRTHVESLYVRVTSSGVVGSPDGRRLPENSSMPDPACSLCDHLSGVDARQAALNVEVTFWCPPFSFISSS